LTGIPLRHSSHGARTGDGILWKRKQRLTDEYQGKAKRKRWQEVVDAGTSKADAEKKYIELGESLIKTHMK
jgi:acyl-CoA-binding protein